MHVPFIDKIIAIGSQQFRPIDIASLARDGCQLRHRTIHLVTLIRLQQRLYRLIHHPAIQKVNDAETQPPETNHMVLHIRFVYYDYEASSRFAREMLLLSTLAI
jgi:hypothetical protein